MFNVGCELASERGINEELWWSNIYTLRIMQQHFKLYLCCVLVLSIHRRGVCLLTTKCTVSLRFSFIKARHWTHLNVSNEQSIDCPRIETKGSHLSVDSANISTYLHSLRLDCFLFWVVFCYLLCVCSASPPKTYISVFYCMLRTKTIYVLVCVCVFSTIDFVDIDKRKMKETTIESCDFDLF